MKSIYIFLAFFILSCGGFAQQESNVIATIKGKVIDAKTNEPVAYTNIGLEGTYFGTASNSEGDFELKIPKELTGKDIFFSAVGFMNLKFPARQLFEKEYSIVKLEPQNYNIARVDIVARSRVLMRILAMAAENTPHNMVAGPLNYNASYTNTITTGNDVVNQSAEVLFYDQSGYRQPSKLNAFNQLNYSIQKSDWEVDYRFSTGKTEIDNLLSFDWVRTASSVLNPGILNEFQLTLDSEPLVLGKECWVISFGQENPTLEGSGDFYASEFKGKITIRKEDYTVLSIEGEIKSPQNSRQGRSLAIGNESDLIQKNVSYNFKTEYRNLMPASISVDKSYSQNNKKVNEKSVLKISDVQTTNLTMLKSREYFTGD